MPKVKELGAKILPATQLKNHRQSLPKSWTDAAGSLKGKLPADPVAWQRKVRAEWEDRLTRQLELAKSRRDD